jgi:hypothetical protein
LLYTIDKERITEIPNKTIYKKWRLELSESQYKEVMKAFEEILDGDDIQVSSLIPEADWDYPFVHIYNACNKDYQSSIYFFGLLMWEAVMKHSATWSFFPKSKKDKTQGTLYFRITLEKI